MTSITLESSDDVRGLLVAWSDGDEEALKNVVSLVYPELRRIGRRITQKKVAAEGGNSLTNQGKKYYGRTSSVLNISRCFTYSVLQGLLWERQSRL